MIPFQEVDDGFALVVSQGVYRIVPLFIRPESPQDLTSPKIVYAKRGQGYIQIKPSQRTSHRSVRWTELHVPGHHKIEFGPFHASLTDISE